MNEGLRKVSDAEHFKVLLSVLVKAYFFVTIIVKESLCFTMYVCIF